MLIFLSLSTQVVISIICAYLIIGLIWVCTLAEYNVRTNDSIVEYIKNYGYISLERHLVVIALVWPGSVVRAMHYKMFRKIVKKAYGHK